MPARIVGSAPARAVAERRGPNIGASSPKCPPGSTTSRAPRPRRRALARVRSDRLDDVDEGARVALAEQHLSRLERDLRGRLLHRSGAGLSSTTRSASERSRSSWVATTTAQRRREQRRERRQQGRLAGPARAQEDSEITGVEEHRDGGVVGRLGLDLVVDVSALGFVERHRADQREPHPFLRSPRSGRPTVFRRRRPRA